MNLTEGRIVHYVSSVPGYQELQHRAAMVVRVWDKATGYVNLTVLPDWSNDGPACGTGLLWKTSVKYSEDPIERTWHWPEEE